MLPQLVNFTLLLLFLLFLFQGSVHRPSAARSKMTEQGGLTAYGPWSPSLHTTHRSRPLPSPCTVHQSCIPPHPSCVLRPTQSLLLPWPGYWYLFIIQHVVSYSAVQISCMGGIPQTPTIPLQGSSNEELRRRLMFSLGDSPLFSPCEHSLRELCRELQRITGKSVENSREIRRTIGYNGMAQLSSPQRHLSKYTQNAL